MVNAGIALKDFAVLIKLKLRAKAEEAAKKQKLQSGSNS